MARKTLKAKEPVRLRTKALSNGNKSLYLDIYQDGKRTYDFLKLYLVPERNAADRAQNEQTLRAANAIKSQRIISIANGTAGIAPKQGKKIMLVEWIQQQGQIQVQRSKASRCAYAKTAAAVEQYAGANVRIADVDAAFCANFIKYLANDYKPRIAVRNGKISPFTALTYYEHFNSALNAAVRKGIIAKNPCTLLSSTDKIKKPEAQRCYLSQDELQGYINAPVKPQTAAAEATKQAFLFSCFSGLRISDIRRLTWANISNDANGHRRIEIVMQKTKAPLYIPLSQQACCYLPERNRAADDDKVFCALPNSADVLNEYVRNVASGAGINKHVTFHTARHTFATLLLTKGADLYTTSKLLGHTDISTTQIYAKIVDAKKQEAVSLLDNIF